MRRFRLVLPGGGGGFPRKKAAFLSLFIRTQQARKPFFEVIHDLLDLQERVTLGQVLDAAGEQTYGLLVLLLSLPSLIPGLNVGAAPVGGLGIMALGCQMAVGVPSPWVPQRVKAQELHRGRIKDGLARVESLLDRFRLREAKRRPLNHGWMGLLIAWTAFLLAIPVPIPFGNILPAAVLVLLGAALLEERPSWGWLGAAGAIGITIYFGLSFDLIVKGIRALAR
jgi:hypothetical protein